MIKTEEKELMRAYSNFYGLTYCGFWDNTYWAYKEVITPEKKISDTVSICKKFSYQEYSIDIDTDVFRNFKEGFNNKK